MIERTLLLAKNSELYKQIIVSTDDDEIIEIVNNHGIHVTKKRPSSLCDDYTSTIDVMSYEVESLTRNLNINEINSVSCLYPCTPLLSEEKMNEAIKLFQKSKSEYVFLAKESGIAFERTFTLTKEQKIKSEMYSETLRSQDVESRFIDAGQFYVGKPGNWISKKPIFSNGSAAIIIGKYDAIDIDTEADWDFSEELFRLRKGISKIPFDE